LHTHQTTADHDHFDWGDPKSPGTPRKPLTRITMLELHSQIQQNERGDYIFLSNRDYLIHDAQQSPAMYEEKGAGVKNQQNINNK